MLSSGLFSLLTERLMLHSNQCTMTTYNVLFEVSDLHKNTEQYRTEKKQIVFVKAFSLAFYAIVFLCFVQAINIKVNGWPEMYCVLVKQIFVFFCFSVVVKLIFMSLIPGRFSQSRSALKWSINSIRTPTPPWRFSTHVSTSSAPRCSP